MCGRARCTLSPAQVARAFGFPSTTTAGGAGGGGGGDAPAVPTLQMDRFRPSYNVSPGAYLPVGAVRARAMGDDGGGAEEHAPVIQCMKWGLVPSFTGKTEKPDHFRMFNARSESIKEKASFRRLIPKNRCLAAVEGFFEWKKDGSRKQPYYVHFQDQRPLVFAALFDTWTNSEGESLRTFTILTTRSSTSLKWLHVRGAASPRTRTPPPPADHPPRLPTAAAGSGQEHCDVLPPLVLLLPWIRPSATVLLASSPCSPSMSAVASKHSSAGCSK